jgi:chemotaxis protein CheD
MMETLFCLLLVRTEKLSLYKKSTVDLIANVLVELPRAEVETMKAPNEDATSVKSIYVGWGENKISSNATEQIIIQSLFSGMGIAAYDPAKQVGGLLHAILPNSSMDLEKAAQNPSLFVDTGIAHLVESLLQRGATKKSLLVYLAGGADIPLVNFPLNLGARNCAAAATALQKLDTPVQSSAVGGAVARCLTLKLAVGGRVETFEDKVNIL